MSVFIAENKSELIVTCGCTGGFGCGQALRIRIDTNDRDYYAIQSYMNGNFSRDQHGAFAVLLWKLKKIWAIIRNKDHYYSDIVMDDKDFKAFKEYINRY